jgi:hypothetical protein
VKKLDFAGQICDFSSKFEGLFWKTGLFQKPVSVLIASALRLKTGRARGITVKPAAALLAGEPSSARTCKPISVNPRLERFLGKVKIDLRAESHRQPRIGTHAAELESMTFDSVKILARTEKAKRNSAFTAPQNP